jgi:hypothetical protein
MSANLYAAPVHDSAPGLDGSAAVWREGSDLHFTYPAQLPARCLACNGPVAKEYQRTWYWHHPGLYFLILLGFWPYAIVALIVRKSATAKVGLCQDHVRRRRRNLALAWGLAVVGTLVLFSSCSLKQDSVALGILAGFATFFAAIIVGMRGSGLLTPKRIDATVARMGGAGVAYLDSLPDRPR